MRPLTGRKVTQENAGSYGILSWMTIMFRSSVDDLFTLPRVAAAYEMRESDWSSDVCSSDLEAFIKALNEYIDYYNNKRIKSRLNGKSPVQYRTLSITCNSQDLF